jgi:hypothetical protein
MRSDAAQIIPKRFLKLVDKHRKVSDKQLSLFDSNKGGLPIQTKNCLLGRRAFFCPEDGCSGLL